MYSIPYEEVLPGLSREDYILRKGALSPRQARASDEKKNK